MYSFVRGQKVVTLTPGPPASDFSAQTLGMDNPEGSPTGDEERLVGGKSHREPAWSWPGEAFANKLPLDTTMGGSPNTACGSRAHPVRPE